MFAVFRRMFSAKAGSTPTEPVAAATSDLNPSDGAALDLDLTPGRPDNPDVEVIAASDLSWWGASHWWVFLLLFLIMMVLSALQGWYDPQWAVPHNLPIGAWSVFAAGFGFLAVLSSLAMMGQLQRAALAQQQALVDSEVLAREQEQETRRINEATQAAILRLMNELQRVAEGDLTQQATVSEDVTGAIADTVNYTVEELRSLVAQVQRTTERVGETSGRVESASNKLLSASSEQLHEIRQTAQSVLDMAVRIGRVSQQTQGAATAAQQSRQAAETGSRAVHEAIEGMNRIRQQMQETSKRIKRLGESTQEIGEITELIDDITEQTQVLALNAAIQAAAAGEAGRGFSVVAEEVQRLAERSADATSQIAARVRAIQVDTQDAVQAMEGSTREVVEGTKRSDNVGAALAEIDRLSVQVADLVAQIATTATHEAQQAGAVAKQIQHGFLVTEQASEGTRATVLQLRELAQLADELRLSVTRFKIA
jgi:twitching motility protein PilJ